MDRAAVRLRRALHARVCRRGGEIRPGLGRGRQGFRPAHRPEQHDPVPVLRGWPARSGDDALRGVLLLFGRR